MRLNVRATSFAICAGVFLVAPALALAALGESITSVQSDSAQIKAAVRIAATTDRYTVHEIQAPSGAVISEYAAPDGTIFAVAWKGPALPDLRQVMGTYFASYEQAAKTKHAGHGRLLIQQPELVVQSAGHMRAFSGKAYIPRLLPAGVTADDIQ